MLACWHSKLRCEHVSMSASVFSSKQCCWRDSRNKVFEIVNCLNALSNNSVTALFCSSSWCCCHLWLTWAIACLWGSDLCCRCGGNKKCMCLCKSGKGCGITSCPCVLLPNGQFSESCKIPSLLVANVKPPSRLGSHSSSLINTIFLHDVLYRTFVVFFVALSYLGNTVQWYSLSRGTADFYSLVFSSTPVFWLFYPNDLISCNNVLHWSTCKNNTLTCRLCN